MNNAKKRKQTRTPNFAYFTLVARDKYVDGAVCMYKSLKDKTHFPLIAMTCELSDEGKKRLTDFGIICRPVKKIVSAKAGIGDNKPRLNDFTYTYTKFHIFSYDDYEKIIYLDSDLIVVKSIDHLFFEETDDFAACACTPYWEDRFNSGVMVIRPDRAIYEDMMAQKDTLFTYDGGDQGFLNSYFKNWKKLDIKYNAGKRIYSETPEHWEKIDHHVIHFVGGKPWLGGEEGYEELERLWFDYFYERYSWQNNLKP
ncbi:glycosyltransferase [uncultured Desulfosarcina sp.]|uniref:glycosyltransferase n=1 Tax=uncultured Desulfosarcina sp. TaxID=218289 RepID=UPI0029C94B1D|nr:glycosyltransferase [uncultured Desulfosarcina sp.]